MDKRLANKLAAARERRRLTAEYLDWVRKVGHLEALADAESDLARHDRRVAALSRELAMRRATVLGGRLRALLWDLVPATIFIVTSAVFTWLGNWDAGVVGLMDGLAAAMIYLYFAKETGRLRL